jgi:hypothetical protein
MANVGNPLVGYADWSSQAALTTTAEIDGTHTVERLQTDQPTETFAALSASTITLILNRGSVQSWNVVALLFTNATVDATWRIRSANTLGALTSGPIYDSGAVAFWMHAEMATWVRRHGLHRPPTLQSSQYLQIDWSDTGNPDDVLRAGNVIVGNFKSLPRAQSVGRKFGFTDASKLTKTVDGRTRPTIVEPAPVQQFTVALLTKADLYACAYELQRLRGASRTVLILVQPDGTDHAHQGLVYGPLEPGPIAEEQWFDQYEATFHVEGWL